MYAGITELRNALFAWGILKSVTFDVPVISIGNLSVGGSGKTPMTRYLIDHLSPEYTIGVLSRGYGRKTTGFKVVETDSSATDVGDEPLEIKLQYPNVVVTVCEDRAMGIPQMLEHEPGIDLILLDDAFQHQYVTPAVSIVLSSYLRPFFKDYVMPVGRLRERRKNIKRADLLVYTKAVQGSRTYITFDKPVFYSSEQYDTLRQVFGSPSNLPSQALVVSGIAHNQLFSSAMENKFDRIKTRSYRDHHRYTAKDIQDILRASKEYDSTIVTTAKDWVKLKAFKSNLSEHVNVFVQGVRVYMENEEEFLKELKQRIHGKG